MEKRSDIALDGSKQNYAMHIKFDNRYQNVFA